MKVTIGIPDWARHIVSDLTDMDRRPHPVDAGRVKSFTLDLPDDVYLEYAFLDEAGEMQRDPGNELKAENPWYSEVSAIVGPDYRPDPYAVRSHKARGRVLRRRIESPTLNQMRRLILYTPAGKEAQHLPVVYLQDGVAYYRYARISDVLEGLIEDAAVRPAHLVFVEPRDRQAEYGFNPLFRTFLVDEVFPLAERDLRASGERVAMGASLGGLLSATLALEHAGLVQTVVAQSGAFLGTPDEPDFYESKRSWVLEHLGSGAGKRVRWYLECGTFEWLADINRRVAQVLKQGGYEYRYLERNAGHNWTNWRNGLSSALRYALAAAG